MNMKLFIMPAVVIIVLFTACSRGYVNQINAGELNIMIKTDRYPLVKGDNQLAVIIVGPTQRTISDAKVEARFYMPAPGVASTAIKTQGVLKGDKYFFTITPTTEGVWKMDLTVSQPHRVAVTTAFGLDVH